MLSVLDMLKFFYLGVNIAITMFYAFTIGDDWFWDKKYTVKQLICNILFPLTIIMYPLGYVIETIIKLIYKINGDKILFKNNRI